MLLAGASCSASIAASVTGDGIGLEVGLVLGGLVAAGALNGPEAQVGRGSVFEELHESPLVVFVAGGASGARRLATAAGTEAIDGDVGRGSVVDGLAAVAEQDELGARLGNEESPISVTDVKLVLATEVTLIGSRTRGGIRLGSGSHVYVSSTG